MDGLFHGSNHMNKWDDLGVFYHPYFWFNMGLLKPHWQMLIDSKDVFWTPKKQLCEKKNMVCLEDWGWYISRDNWVYPQQCTHGTYRAYIGILGDNNP